MTQMLIHDGPVPPGSDAEQPAERRWAVVFTLSAAVPTRDQEKYLDQVPLRAAFVDGPATGPILVLRSTGPKMTAFAGALTAFQHLMSSSGGAIDFKSIEMVPHEQEPEGDEASSGAPVALISVKGAAEKLGVSVQRARQLLKDQKLPPADAAERGRPLWRESEFERFANARRAAVAETPLGHGPSPVDSLSEYLDSLGWAEDDVPTK